MARGQVWPSSLAEAHAVLVRERPARDAALEVWVAFHHRGAAVYAEMMRVDPQFKYEASWYSSTELQIAREIEVRLGLWDR